MENINLADKSKKLVAELFEFFSVVRPDLPGCFATISEHQSSSTYFLPTPVEDNEELAQVATEAQLNKLPGGHFFSCAGFDSAEPFERKADRVISVKSLYFDIDVRDSKPNCYQTIYEAREALKVFIDKNNLPQPTYVVNSGHGIHSYFSFTEPLSRDEFLEEATSLEALAKSQGLLIDAGITCDAARVLRVPNSVNVKLNQGHPRCVITDANPTALVSV
jgi:hypothetical protein